MDLSQFESRKREHIRHALDPAHQAAGRSGLEKIHLLHEALPEIDFGDVKLESSRLGSPSKKPFYVAGMTAGHPDAFKINRALAFACETKDWAMGVGSQRRELEGPSVDDWQRLRQEMPRLTLVANLGISQLIGTNIEKIAGLIARMGASAIAIHLNALQEAIQPEGTPQFRGGLKAIESLCEQVAIPVIVKETGCGFSRQTLSRLAGTGISAVDVSGLGGTHWGRIEGARAEARSIQAQTALTFANWGESTVDSVVAARETLPGSIETWASGGVRSGLDAAKLIALGAHQVGYAKPALEMALAGPEALIQWMELQEHELKVALFCTGSASPIVLRERSNPALHAHLSGATLGRQI